MLRPLFAATAIAACFFAILDHRGAAAVHAIPNDTELAAAATAEPHAYNWTNFDNLHPAMQVYLAYVDFGGEMRVCCSPLDDLVDRRWMTPTDSLAIDDVDFARAWVRFWMFLRANNDERINLLRIWYSCVHVRAYDPTQYRPTYVVGWEC